MKSMLIKLLFKSFVCRSAQTLYSCLCQNLASGTLEISSATSTASNTEVYIHVHVHVHVPVTSYIQVYMLVSNADKRKK